MTIVNVVVKWNAQKYPVAVDLDQPGIVFKTQLFSLTNVAPDRQKIMVKGGMLKDDGDMKSLNLKENQQLMMMGTIGELKEPVEKPKFMEDMTDAEISKALKLPAGLTNLGNTCYLNSTLQCLRAVPELQVAIKKSQLGVGSNQYANFAVSMKALFEELDSSGNAVQPLVFLQLMRSLFPQFSERDRNGFMQQDAEECWGQLIHGLSEQVKGLNENGESNPNVKFVDQFMTTELISETKCDEAPTETPSVSVESVNKIRVNISSGVSTFMFQEIANGLVEKIEKNSPTLNRNAIYTKTSKISRLPQYLTVNFVRFQWKPQEKIKAKILKRVQFPFELDMYSFCTEELQRKLEPAKQRVKEVSDRKAEEKKKKIKVDETIVKKDQKSILQEIGADSMFISDPGLNPSGMYDLAAVLTHAGRGANSGHYIGWAKDTESDNWWKFDDDKVTQIKAEDITKLEGGQGDAPSAYIYRAKQLE